MVYLESLGVEAERTSEAPRPRQRRVVPVIDPQTRQLVTIAHPFPNRPFDATARPLPARPSKALPIVSPSHSADLPTDSTVPPPPRPSKALPIVSPAASSPTEVLPPSERSPELEDFQPQTPTPALWTPPAAAQGPSGGTIGSLPPRPSRALPIVTPTSLLTQGALQETSHAPSPCGSGAGDSTSSTASHIQYEEATQHSAPTGGESNSQGTWMDDPVDRFQPLEGRFTALQAAMQAEEEAFRSQLQSIEEEYQAMIQQALRWRQKSRDDASIRHEERSRTLAAKQHMVETVRTHLHLTLHVVRPSKALGAEEDRTAWLEGMQQLQQCVLAATDLDPSLGLV
eukprot:GGOE01015144.1.p1 GENE.GGOE01015144.1~~GGOE01015144.1.p1  ORF type:complete len:399 (-),score=91.01 GGOE01015144.1:273-1298(-)